MKASEPASTLVPPATATPPADDALTLGVNGRPTTYTGRPGEPLVWVLRDLGLTGTKPGCGIGVCGACIVLMDGEPARSCLVTAAEAADREITTIEGLVNGSSPDELHPVQRAFIEAGAAQCGWCMSGQVLMAVALLDRIPQPTDDEVVATMSEVLCRCGAYGRIRAAIHAVANGAVAQSARP
jgi:isoquinoline 1-oxidoreductase alpha subunit